MITKKIGLIREIDENVEMLERLLHKLPRAASFVDQGCALAKIEMAQRILDRLKLTALDLELELGK
jgi:hypothetical protein